MDCPKCHKAELTVIDSRDVDNDSVRRRRECDNCGFRFTTYEKIEPIKITVLKKDGSLEPYDRNKVIKGMRIATEKRDISTDTLEEVTDKIEQKLIETGESVIPSKIIGDLVIAELKELDEVAYLRFASVYKEFRSPKSFKRELEKLSKR